MSRTRLDPEELSTSRRVAMDCPVKPGNDVQGMMRREGQVPSGCDDGTAGPIHIIKK